MTREEVIAKLKEGFVSIEFDKVDGNTQSNACYIARRNSTASTTCK